MIRCTLCHRSGGHAPHCALASRASHVSAVTAAGDTMLSAIRAEVCEWLSDPAVHAVDVVVLAGGFPDPGLRVRYVPLADPDAPPTVPGCTRYMRRD